MKSQLDKLEDEIFDALDALNKWELPKGMKGTIYSDDKDFHRGGYSALQFIWGQLKSIRRKEKRPKRTTL